MKLRYWVTTPTGRFVGAAVLGALQAQRLERHGWSVALVSGHGRAKA